jgi:hypothetical protein
MRTFIAAAALLLGVAAAHGQQLAAINYRQDAQTGAHSGVTDQLLVGHGRPVFCTSCRARITAPQLCVLGIPHAPLADRRIAFSSFSVAREHRTRESRNPGPPIKGGSACTVQAPSVTKQNPRGDRQVA